MAMRMRMAHELTVHVEQGDTSEHAMGYTQSIRHGGPGVKLRGST
jgi:hypothetical protein